MTKVSDYCPFFGGDCPHERASTVAEFKAQLAVARAAAVEWHTYDGTLETLPVFNVLVLCRHSKSSRTEIASFSRYTPDDYVWLNPISRQWVTVQNGDRWTYLPTPPEGE